MSERKKHQLTTWIGTKIFIFACIGMVLSFAGGIVVANGSFSTTLSQKMQGNEEWAKSAGLISANTTVEQKLTQAEFLKILMTIYKPKKQGVIVPKGAENHWAAPHYATAKQEGLIDCSCQIAPDKEISFQDTTKFVMKAINKKTEKDTVALEEVQAWVKHTGGANTPVSVGEALVLLRKMDELMVGNIGQAGGKGNDEKDRK
ncbi:hypothetical protein [Brevibacillus sp. SYSU BS000544]|uniref:hypothetical protein n=1 Tax=Brevibacillus sp. SYSU BS000544 TaxID=3416443 RepID=UPI003CE53F9C